MDVLILDGAGAPLGRAPVPRISPPLPPELQALYDYWSGLPIGRAVPPKAVIAPDELVRILPHVFLCRGIPHEAAGAPGERSAVRASLRINFPVHGSEVAGIVGRDLTGKALDEVLPEVRARRVADAIALCMTQARPVRQRMRSAFPDREYLLVDRLIVPLEDAEGAVSYALGALVRCDLRDEAPLQLREA